MPDKLKVTEEPFQRQSKAWHISQKAIDICNELNLDPADAIVYLNMENVQIRDINGRIDTKLNRILTELQELKRK